MPRVGERHEHKGVILEIVEVLPYKIPLPSGSFREYYLVGYRIIDGNFRSPVAHFYIERGKDITMTIQTIIENYLENKSQILRILR